MYSAHLSDAKYLLHLKVKDMPLEMMVSALRFCDAANTVSKGKDLEINSGPLVRLVGQRGIISEKTQRH
jgi:hypothetical protein